MFTKQAPQKLKVLREHALIENAVSSNRIEGVEVDPSRVGTIVFGKALLRDRDEEEVRGYTKALDLIHTKGSALPITELVLEAIRSQGGEFRLADIERTCPGVGRDWIRALLADLRRKGKVSCRGRGPAARWQVVPSKGSTLKYAY